MRANYITGGGGGGGLFSATLLLYTQPLLYERTFENSASNLAHKTKSCKDVIVMQLFLILNNSPISD